MDKLVFINIKVLNYNIRFQGKHPKKHVEANRKLNLSIEKIRTLFKLIKTPSRNVMCYCFQAKIVFEVANIKASNNHHCCQLATELNFAKLTKAYK